MEVRGIRLKETPQGLQGSLSRKELERFLLSLPQNAPDKVYFNVFQFANPRPEHTHGMKLRRESIALLQ